MPSLTICAWLLASIASLTSAQGFTLPPKLDCGSVSQPNTIASTYPNNATGVLNGTLAILPLSFDIARKYIPAQYKILTHAYQHVLPGLPQGTYPALVQLMHDHDIRMGSIMINDFQRASIEFPFIDLLDDNATSFRYVPEQFILATNPIAVAGVATYGAEAVASLFDPSCNAYNQYSNGSITFQATSAAPPAQLGGVFNSVTADMLKTSQSAAAALSTTTLFNYFKNSTNQPSFGDGKVCDNMIRIYDPQGKQGPEWRVSPVIGTVYATNAIPAAGSAPMTYSNVVGMKAPSRFIENNAVSCQSLQYYSEETADEMLKNKASSKRSQEEGSSIEDKMEVNQSTVVSKAAAERLTISIERPDLVGLLRSAFNSDIGVEL